MATPPPRLAGRLLTAARIAAEAPGTGAAVREVMRRGLRVDLLPTLPDELRGPLAMEHRPLSARPAPRELEDAALGAPETRPWPRVSAAYQAAFRGGHLTPRRLAERALGELEALASRTPTMNVLAASDKDRTLRDADAATARHADGRALGPFDGVPFLVKDEFDVEGLPTRLGSRCEPDGPAAKDSTVVARMRAAGAIVAGKTVLTEWGMSPIGNNTAWRMPHNPFDPTRAAGGSSTGSAVGVALGLAPIAAGGDGGGSIRIPSSLCGLFGLKPTFGRVSRAGDLFAGSVAHAGPIASSTADLAAFLDVVASEHDPEDPITRWAPSPPKGGFGARLGAGVRGLRIGVDDDEWRDASPAVARAGDDALRALERDGAFLVRVRSRLVRYAAPIGYLTIGPESLAAVRGHWLERRHLIQDDVRLTFSVLEQFSAFDQLDAQRLRAGLRREVAALLADVDVLALPTTAITAPRFTEEDARSTFTDAGALDGLCRFAFLGNLTGLPAGTAPVGVDAGGLPIGLQIVGDAWNEAGVLAVLAHLERTRVAEVRRPPGAIDLL
jgi:aspartyl-tRNA(Asn)/glutamyl-tRNA(Gln) amidotransferase subunit A